ncbi:hypothetical protein [Hymenobacter properus]|uniref:Uncharacterized protein n=1 Tax=Hymenobacter properus TaxID=2791026 RepID=A0A931BBS2_9BACT|nr:hypothetical protein [Hymenobacter properus]MBF9140844.1 hypothetical protein [Hymenobacter properus]MBR7719653.1 hypothetical protein [Microvirga sp. SRT04]
MKKLRDDECIHEQYTIPIFEVKLHVLVANDMAAAWGILWPEIGLPDPAAFGLFWFEESTRTAYMGLRGDANAQTVAHEALHITHAILENIGHKPSYTNSEIECYLLGYIVNLATPTKKDKRIKHPAL